MSLTAWQEYMAMVRSWRHVKPEDVEHAEFVGNAIDTGQTDYQAAVGWQLTQHNARHASLPRKLRKRPARVRHEGRVTRRQK